MPTWRQRRRRKKSGSIRCNLRKMRCPYDCEDEPLREISRLPEFPFLQNIKPYHTGEEKEEISDVDCDKCGAKMVYRQGPYGRYLKCPECGQNKAIVIDTGIECPKCHEGHLVKRRSKRGRYFYGCSHYPACDMAVWDEPVNEFCSVCGAIKVKKVRKIRRKSLSALIPSAQRIRKRKL